MTLTTTTLRPGLIVRLSVKTTGNVTYDRTELVADHITDEGSRLAEWNTRKEIEDAAEADRAEKARSKCRSLVRSACIQSGEFGLLCLKRNREALNAAVTEARDVANKFNRTAELSQITVSVMIGEIAESDAEAMRSIGSEITTLLDGMEAGVAKLNVDAIREAANRAKALAQMLEPGVADKVEAAIEMARQVATEVRKAEKAGEAPGLVADRPAIVAISAARSVFLDLDETVAPVGAPVAQSPTLDI